MSSKNMFVYVLLLALIVVIGGCTLVQEDQKANIDQKEQFIKNKTPEKEYFGSSTKGFCESDNDCIISGCNSEICQNKNEERLMSICKVSDKPTPKQLGYKCGCIANSCQWYK